MPCRDPPKEVSVTTDDRIHYVDVARREAELRTACGASLPQVQWTTLRGAADCSQCRRAAAESCDGPAEGAAKA
jgi:hypothetical protein